MASPVTYKPGADPATLNDLQFLEWALRERGPLTTMEIIRLSETMRDGIGLTPHSRASDLRDRLRPFGWGVDCEIVMRANTRKGREHRYELTTPPVVIEATGQARLMLEAA